MIVTELLCLMMVFSCSCRPSEADGAVVNCTVRHCSISCQH